LSAEEIGEKMQEKYDSLEDYRGVMVTSFETDGEVNIHEARFSFKKPKKAKE
jgi:outer membrane lipoprotein-sorting protein